MSSPAFIHAPEGNDCARRFVCTREENLAWVCSFDIVEELHRMLMEF